MSCFCSTIRNSSEQSEKAEFIQVDLGDASLETIVQIDKAKSKRLIKTIDQDNIALDNLNNWIHLLDLGVDSLLTDHAAELQNLIRQREFPQ